MSQLDHDRRGPSDVRRFGLDRQRAALAGVCSGIADYLGWDVILVRLGFVLGTLLGFGSLILVYLIIWAIAD